MALPAALDLAAFWGKAQPADDAVVRMHPLTAHALDVAAVAMQLPGARRLGLDPATLGFWIALHDIGKFCGAFQSKAPEHWPTDQLGPWHAAIVSYPHDALGLHLLTHGVRAELAPAIAPDARGRRLWIAPILQALAGHHGRPAIDLPAIATRKIEPGAARAAQGFVALLRALFQPPPLPWPGSDVAVTRLGWQLAGLTTLADWVGSRRSWFPYVPPQAVHDPADYLHHHAQPQARHAIAEAGLGTARVAPFGGVAHLFPAISDPTPVQRWAETVSLPAGPVLAVIEDLTGSGKTEAALTLAHRLLADGRAEGVFVALPTMATANAMYARLAGAYRNLFAADAQPSLALAHGRAWLDPRFQATFAPDRVDPGPSPADPADEPAEAQCTAWLAKEGRRSLLAHVGVGTIDQALFSILPARHAVLRQQALAGKVLLIDEAHAFDAYMRREIIALLRFHAALGGSAILLSATLPRAQRQALVDAFRDGLAAPAMDLIGTAYPLATLAGQAEIVETPCAVRPGLPRRVEVLHVPQAEAVIDHIVEAARAGAAVAWVRNTVDDAIAAAEACRARGLEPLLFHARFAMTDRLAVEAEVLRRFGKHGDPAARPGVLIATQVIEQSLDLDFDLLCSDLAPVDLLIQRAGRLWRHDRAGRPIAGPRLLLLAPPPLDEPDIDWLRRLLPGTEAVYRDPALLWRTTRAVLARGAITTPDDMRPLIETVFDADTPGQVPPALALAAERAEGEARAAFGVAAQNVLDFDQGYRRDAGLWERDDRTPTRLETESQMTLRLARLRDGHIVPYAEDPDPRRAWALSEVGVAERLIARCPIPPGLEVAAGRARAGWSRWERESERLLLAVLNAEGRLSTIPRAGGVRESVYGSQIGLLPSLPD